MTLPIQDQDKYLLTSTGNTTLKNATLNMFSTFVGTALDWKMEVINVYVWTT
jgi:hypothetical protein